MSYFTQSGERVRSPAAYAETGAPMYTTKHADSRDINAPTYIYKLNLEKGKKYIGKTVNVRRRMRQHFTGKGAAVTKKFKPIDHKVIDQIPGFFANEVEQYHTECYTEKYGYENVRGGYWTTSTNFW